MSKVLSIDNLHVAIGGKEILQGRQPHDPPGRDPCPDGPQRLGQEHAELRPDGPPELRGHRGHGDARRPDLLALEADERAKAGLFLAFQYPTSIPGVTVANFLRHAVTNVRNPDRKEGEDLIPMRDFRKELREQMDELGIDPEFARRYLNEGFSGGEKKRAEVLQLAMLRPAFAILDETDSGLDIDAVRVVSEGVNRVAARNGTGVLVITHYQRILNYIKPAVRPHPLRRPDRRERRPRAGRAARERGLRLGPRQAPRGRPGRGRDGGRPKGRRHAPAAGRV